MESEIELRQYELAYHLTPDLEDAEVAARSAEMAQTVTQSGGTIVMAQEPRRAHLSYPLQHKHYAHFGYIYFQGTGDTLDAIKSSLKLQEWVLRFTLLRRPDNAQLIRTLGDRLRRVRPGTHVRDEKKVVKAPAPTVAEQAKMTKEIEEVLEKI